MPSRREKLVTVLIEGRRAGVSRRRLYDLAAFVLRRKRCGVRALCVWVVGNRSIRRLNRRYLGHDRATDVIAFPADGGKYLGDVAVSVERTSSQARRFGSRPDEELERCVVHGILHLVGYRDNKKAEREKMHRAQERLLRDFSGSHNQRQTS